jgi:hypothetical protein
MNKLLEILAKVNEAVKNLLTKIEESSAFEKVMIAYEAMDPTRQALTRGVMRLSALSLGLFILFSPLWTSYSTKSTIKTFDESTFQLQVLAARGTEVVSQAPKPSTWQNLPASSSAELENSIREYLANIGVPEELYVAQADGIDRFNLNIEELTLRQALALTFQFDGWYPAVRAENLEINVHAKNPDRLSLKIAAYIPAAIPGGGEGLDGHDHGFEGQTHEVDPNGMPIDSGGSHFGGDNPDYFESDPNQIPPPPPEFDDNPPPPPPSFEENYEDNPPVFEEGNDL